MPCFTARRAHRFCHLPHFPTPALPLGSPGLYLCIRRLVFASIFIFIYHLKIPKIIGRPHRPCPQTLTNNGHIRVETPRSKGPPGREEHSPCILGPRRFGQHPFHSLASISLYSSIHPLIQASRNGGNLASPLALGTVKSSISSFACCCSSIRICSSNL